MEKLVTDLETFLPFIQPGGLQGKVHRVRSKVGRRGPGSLLAPPCARLSLPWASPEALHPSVEAALTGTKA